MNGHQNAIGGKKQLNKFTNNHFVITGGNGFLGKHVVEELKQIGVFSKNIKVISSNTSDLRNIDNVRKILKENDIVIHLAAKVGGLAVNINKQADFFYENAIMAMNMIQVGNEVGIKKFVGIGSIWEYPDKLAIPFKETSLWDGYPAEITAPYGLAKKVMLMMSQFYKDQYNLNCIHLLLTNLYGPGDDFNPSSSHVIPSLIYKIDKARSLKKTIIDVWGDGSASRELLYVKDAAEAIILATKFYDNKSPLNIGSGHRITIKDLVFSIIDLMNFRGEVKWDITKVVGQKFNQFDVSLAKEKINFEAKTSLINGLNDTIYWYMQSKK